MPHEDWRTGPPHKHLSPIVKPSGRQTIRQVLILLLMVIVWGGMLAIWAGATASSDLAVASVVTPTPLPTVPASPTVTALPATATVTTAPATATPPATSTRPAATATTAPATATPEATSTRPAATATQPAVTDTSTATSTPTADTPVPIEPPATPSQADSNTVSFARDVQPIFNRVCVKCHGGEEVKEGLVLKTYVEIMAGSDNGPVIAPGDPANSLLIDLITRGEMPKQGPKLLPGQIRIITDWVAAGAVNN